jgi:hypothetical protein
MNWRKYRFIQRAMKFTGIEDGFARTYQEVRGCALAEKITSRKSMNSQRKT